MCSHTFFTLATAFLVLFSQHLTHVEHVAVLAEIKTELWYKSRALADTLPECSDAPSTSTASPQASENGIKPTQPCYQCQKSYICKLQETLKTLNSFINPPFYVRLLFLGEYKRSIKLLDDCAVALEAQIKALAHSEAFSHQTTQPSPANATNEHPSPPAGRTPEVPRTYSEPPESREHATGAPPSASNLRRHSSCPQLPPFASSTEHRSPETASPNSVSNRGALIGDIHIHVSNVGNVLGTKYNYTEVEDHSTHKRSRGHQCS